MDVFINFGIAVIVGIRYGQSVRAGESFAGGSLVEVLGSGSCVREWWASSKSDPAVKLTSYKDVLRGSVRRRKADWAERGGGTGVMAVGRRETVSAGSRVDILLGGQ